MKTRVPANTLTGVTVQVIHRIQKGMMGGLTTVVLLLIQPLCLSARGYTPIAPFRLTQIGGFVGSGLEREDEIFHIPKTTLTTDTDETIFTEEVGSSFQGYIYHPKFLEFGTDVVLELRQERSHANETLQNEERDNLLEYNFNVNLLRDHPVSARVGGNQQRQEIRSDFFETTLLTSRGLNVGLNYNNPRFPINTYYSTEDTNGEGINLTDETEERWITQIQNSGILGENRARYEYRKRTEGRREIQYRSNRVDLHNSFGFGKESRNNLLSALLFEDEKGTTPQRNVTLEEDLQFHPSRSLNYYYNYFYSDLRFEGFENVDTSRSQHRAGLTHRLFKSLTTGLDIGAEKLRIDSGTDDTLYGRARWDYTKRIPYGRINLNYQFRMENEDEDLSGSLIRIKREEHRFGENPEGDTVIVLKNDLIDPGSIEFVDRDGLPLEDPSTGLPIEEGFHYRLEAVGPETKIRLLTPEGDFLRGQDIFVNYVFEPRPALEFNTVGNLYGASVHLWDMWKIYFQGGRIRQYRVNGTDLDRLENVRDTIFGTELRWRFSRTLLEKSIHRSRRTPYKTRTFTEEIRFPGIGASTVSLLGSYADTKTFPFQPKTIDRVVALEFRWPLLRKAVWKLETIYRNQDLLVENQESVEVRSKLRWRYGKLEMLLTYEYRTLMRSVSGDDDRQRIFFKFRRSFGSGTRRALR